LVFSSVTKAVERGWRERFGKEFGNDNGRAEGEEKEAAMIAAGTATRAGNDDAIEAVAGLNDCVEWGVTIINEAYKRVHASTHGTAAFHNPNISLERLREVFRECSLRRGGGELCGEHEVQGLTSEASVPVSVGCRLVPRTPTLASALPRSRSFTHTHSRLRIPFVFRLAVHTHSHTHSNTHSHTHSRSLRSQVVLGVRKFLAERAGIKGFFR